MLINKLDKVGDKIDFGPLSNLLTKEKWYEEKNWSDFV